MTDTIDGRVGYETISRLQLMIKEALPIYWKNQDWGNFTKYSMLYQQYERYLRE